MSVVLAAHRWPTNAELISDVAKLGYLDHQALSCDLTYGLGVWWKKWRPRTLVCHDIKLDGVDFSQLPEDDETYEQIAYDPPYVSTGGRKTSTIADFNDRFGLDEAPTTPALLQDLITAGMSEAKRVLMPDGIIVMKTMDYVSSGKLWPGTYLATWFAIDQLGLELLDRFEHIGHARAQPKNRTRKPTCAEVQAGITYRQPSIQHHARRNLSTLLIFRKRK